jgi:hypothetical protein
MPGNFNYDLGIPAEKTLPEFFNDDPLEKIESKIQKLTLNFSRDMDSVYKERSRLVDFDEGYDYNACGKLPMFF